MMSTSSWSAIPPLPTAACSNASPTCPFPSFGITFGNPTPDDLYPTDVYTPEYGGFADFPQYPIDPLSDLNAIAGMIYEHLTYVDLDPGQIQNAIPLETTTPSPITT
jgi:hypothetical protein